MILITHKYVVYDDWKNKAWTENEFINLISKGIDNSLFPRSATLLVQLIKTIHKVNQDVVVSRQLKPKLGLHLSC